MESIEDAVERRTATDVVFDRLFDAIFSLEFLPGTKLSEAEIAKRFGVSRQPVRDAFAKLEAQGLLLIRPQKATQVRGFSKERIAHARFVRLAVELEVVRRACENWKPEYSDQLAKNLVEQRDVIDHNNLEELHRLDYEFHKLICTFSGHRLAFDTIKECKSMVDRLCMLSLRRQSEAKTLLSDHEELAQAIGDRDVATATATIRLHLGRLDDTITTIHQSHAEFFE
ncbi:MAG: GntR family transcriptional regulator [Pseudomonadota bacterium]